MKQMTTGESSQPVQYSMSQKQTPSPRSLKQVLNVSVPQIEVNGVIVSTSPSKWTILKDIEYKKLQLTPKDPSRFPSAYKPNIYYAIVFKSLYANFRFFLEQKTDTQWYILARPPTDLKKYVRNEPGWECGGGGM